MSASASSALVILGAALVSAAGAVLASLVATRRSPRNNEPQQIIKPPRVRHSDRLHRLEQWQDQYADPLLHRIQNALDWTPPNWKPDNDD